MKQARMDGAFGAIVTDIDVRTLDDDAMCAIAQLLYEQRIVVIRGQDLDHATYVEFGRRWGKPIDFLSKKNTLAEFPEIIVQSNSAATPGILHNNASHWHCDSSYEPVPAAVTMLYGVVSPSQGGVTLFADLIGAYRTLDEQTRERIETLEARHMPGRGKVAQGETMIRYDTMPDELRENADRWGPVTHPLVRTHPVNGAKGLYGLGGTPFEVPGMELEDGLALIARLKAHATQDRYVQGYKLMPGDVLLWDNLAVMHRATPIDYSDAPADRRLNYRISVKGLPPFMAGLPEQAHELAAV